MDKPRNEPPTSPEQPTLDLPANVACFHRDAPETDDLVTSKRHLYLEQLRDRKLSYQQFRHTADKLFKLIADAKVAELSHHEIILTPIFRAGLSMLPFFMSRLKNSRLCAIGVRRNEQTALPEPYLFKVPPEYAPDARFVILEPMIATAGTMCYSLGMLKQTGVNLEHVQIISIFAALAAVERLQNEFPEVEIQVEVVDPILDDKKFIVPGCGDFGDRYFGT